MKTMSENTKRTHSVGGRVEMEPLSEMPILTRQKMNNSDPDLTSLLNFFCEKNGIPCDKGSHVFAKLKNIEDYIDRLKHRVSILKEKRQESDDG